MEELDSALNKAADAKIAKHSRGFFKTAAGQYGEGDQFLGIRVPVLRQLVSQSRALTQTTIISLLTSAWHEKRLLALLILVDRYQRANQLEKEVVVATYLSHMQHINNWDLVDSSCHKILGPWLMDKDKDLLFDLAASECLWHRRIAMMSSYYFIKQHEFSTTLKLAKLLIDDKEDLIHKVVGWMLREVGNRNKETELAFLNMHYTKMPRVMLRYAIEKFPENQRQLYLKGLV
jgi:3-methyladenine DNA glycosylase AlkD